MLYYLISLTFFLFKNIYAKMIIFKNKYIKKNIGNVLLFFKIKVKDMLILEPHKQMKALARQWHTKYAYSGILLVTEGQLNLTEKNLMFW